MTGCGDGMAGRGKKEKSKGGELLDVLKLWDEMVE